VIQTPSGLAFTRDGERFENGAFGGGLRHAVDGVPQAEAQAELHSRLLVGGLLLEMGGVALAGASIVTVVRVDDSGGGLDTALALARGAVALSVVSSLLYESSETHVWDAVNAYNHAVERASLEAHQHELPRETPGP
jgi:hypothetical protein